MKKIIIGIIIGGLIFGSIGVFATSKLYARDVSINTPTESSLGSNATLQDSLDELYSKINSYTKKYPNGTAVYYNPDTGEKCTFSESKSTTGTKSGCMKWYTFNDEEGNASVNLILDHNTTARVAYNSSGNNSEMKEVATALSNDTKNWVVGARLIKANEIAKITGNTSFDASIQEWFCLETNKQDYTSSPYCNKTSTKGWLFDHTYCIEKSNNWGCLNNDTSTYGYWTNSASNNSTNVWYEDRFGLLSTNVVSTNLYGVRPVISVSKFIIS